MVDRVGQQLGNYRLVRLLGQGGFAEVYLSEHLHLGTQAAIKILHTHIASEDVEIFRREARTIAHLVHPHIVRVFDFEIEGTTPFLVMDYAPNGTLRMRHPKGVPLPLPTIISYVRQIADALQYAHDEHLIHRDIKPENILLGRRQEILLSDFGIALIAQTSRSQSIQDVAGTATYMAPEQFQGKPRPASDQYALGIVVYEWLSGACPFHGSFTEIASQHLFVPPPPLQGKESVISPAVEQVVMTALAKEPKERFATVQALATALEQTSQLDTPTYVKLPTSQMELPRMATLSRQPLDVAVTPPKQPLQPTLETIPFGEQQRSTQTSQIEGFARSPQSKKNSHLGLILGSLFLLVMLISGSIFFFTMNKGNISVANNTSTTGAGTNSPTSTPTSSSITASATLKHLPNGTADLNWDATSQVLTVKISLIGLAPNSTHPAHIHSGSCANQGPVVYPLNNVVADAHGVGTSMTLINNVATIPTNGWYINVHNGPGLSPSDQFLPIVCNDLSFSTVSPTSSLSLQGPLNAAPPASAGETVSGMAQLTLSGSTLTVKLTLSGLEPNSMHAAHIHAGSCESQGAVIYPLTTVMADASGNATVTTTINNVSSIPSSGWYVNVHHSNNLSTQTGFDPVACGNVKVG